MAAKLMTVKDVAERLNCSESLIYNLLASGALRHYRLGRSQGGIRVSEEQMQAYLLGREKGGESPLMSPPALPASRAPALKHLSLD